MQHLSLETANWIWCGTSCAPDEYGEFYTSFSYETGNVTLRISADSNYAAYLNGTLCACGQYADYPHDKIYDTVDLTSFCKQGKNHLAVVVWYYGVEYTSVYCKGNAALLEAVNAALHKCVDSGTFAKYVAEALELAAGATANYVEGEGIVPNE